MFSEHSTGSNFRAKSQLGIPNDQFLRKDLQIREKSLMTECSQFVLSLMDCMLCRETLVERTSGQSTS